MAPRRTQQEEAIAAGERNVVPGQAWLAALIRGIGREMQGSQGTPFGQATREELGSLGYEQMLREQYPEEFARGRLRGSEMFPTDIASMYAMRPGRSTFAPVMGAAERQGALEAPAAMPRLTYTPVAEAPAAAAPRGSFDANMMAAFRRGEVGSRPAGRPQAFRPDDFLAIEQGPFAQSPNAFEGNMVLAQRRGVPSPAPANYDYQGPARPGPITERPMSDFDRASIGANWSGTGKGQYGRFVPGSRTGAFREGDFAPYTPEEMGQGLVPYRSQAMREVPPDYSTRGGPVGFQLLPPSQRGGLPMMAEGEGIPYADFRDVTGNVLRGPAREMPYGGAMDFGVTREGAGARGGIPYGKIAAGLAGVGIPAFVAYDRSSQQPLGARPAPMDARMADTRGAQQLPPIDVYGRGMTMGAPVAAPVETPRAAKKAMPKVPVPPKRPAEMTPAQQQQWEGNLNYYVTQMLDSLTGQDEAERGRRTQQYYEQNPY